MNIAVESPPPHTKRTLPGTIRCVGDVEVDAQEALHRNKRRLASSFGAGARDVGYPELCVSSAHGVQFGAGLDLSPSENLHVNNRNALQQGVPVSKRTRYLESEAAYHQPQGQQQHSLQNPQYRNSNVQETLYRALKALFPGMRDETIAQVLEACGEDVDAAIRRLNELKLEGGEHGHEDGEVDRGIGIDEKRVKECDKSGEEASTSMSSVPKQDKIEIKAGWVEALVSEMSQARDVEDAKGRAARVLEGVLQDNAAGPGGGHAADGNLQRENALLKRAVGIQNNKIHELGEKCKSVDELVAKLEEANHRCQALEMHNYSLQVHLKEATSRWQHNGNEAAGGRDVY
mmetsp:Transcript_350/g.928  ORF Transcript_350/g.928 Transcript_350/m.928 type:complete len:346 (+) Transcript_350:178-1215(+)|eukprot:CAMPEP_0182605154 /NCGR_PEP_ID=MMETSP1330-20130603/139_1 /TAXON_ID=464278 /ORGANISM="Picochlorum sp., Strain RCC944" /LENGTH=345 /DNA_ID=CAMNT_0024823115 /DNA_START=142 /DNA_END=1179 /DNA_ORIENTATION=+